MFFNLSDITIDTTSELSKLALKVSKALNIFEMKLDKSGKYEDDVVYRSVCFGLEFELAKDDNLVNSYHLSVNSDTNSFDFNGTEKEVDGSQYIILLLKNANVKAAPRDKNLLY